jgi:hypothetical protein
VPRSILSPSKLSAVTGFVVATLAVQVPAPTFGVKFVGQEVKVGLMLSVTTVYEQAVFPAASDTVSNSCSS